MSQNNQRGGSLTDKHGKLEASSGLIISVAIGSMGLVFVQVFTVYLSCIKIIKAHLKIYYLLKMWIFQPVMLVVRGVQCMTCPEDFLL